ncbi:Zn(II)2Cys6 transcription factor [Aspergillus clavatus NRRL 1]|uniref:C6 transcription factor, putative n=1 Tax=Aspergillus clavatus (strain ATCC 1007 / CBS 513.65 / DSM 816 / NCTC 3887 / NRRL 1 / QM 1276 / 107) TaxID=344612 RepID=A1CK62_ASPCL|nr:C6 transcription factor, putative [Aspergillus clavatus NRRL 1]EAW09536.1 C6 transcription factor, putative [Aspergillus clavatus NRRL 1]
MLSMQNTPAFYLPSAANLTSHRGIQQPNAPTTIPTTTDHANTTHSLTLSEIPTFPDDGPAMDDALSHHESVSTDGVSNDSPDSWDGEGQSDRSTSADYEVKIHDASYPFVDSNYSQMPVSSSSAAAAAVTILTAASKPFRINFIAANNPSDTAMVDDDVTPKVEEIEEVEGLQSIKPIEVGTGNPTPAAAPVNVPRKRGRPRKHPLPVPGGQIKITKGRSKTGCITCRRRKKKCDETKPSCLNCQKNAVVCEGYPPKEIWKSGKQKMEDARSKAILAAVPRSLPLLIDGVETEIDRRFLDHFVHGFSRVLTLINDDTNPFKEILLPMAAQHRGLMHSLMCLSGSHLSALDPEPKLKERKFYHFHHAIQDLKDNIMSSSIKSSGDTEESELLVEDPIIASTIALSLNTICEGETNGEYRPHMDAARYLLVTQQPRNEKFRQFIVEFFQYHDVSNSITSLDRRPALGQGDLRLPDFVPHAQAGMFLGVFDGLFNYISDVTRLRDRIRQRFNEGYEPAVDYQILSDAVSIDSAIRAWETSHAPDTPNWCLAQLYRQSTWVYLYRTIRPSKPSEKIAQVVDDGLAYLDQLPQDSGAFSIVLMPLFLLGCSAFLTRQRERIQKGFEALKAYSNLRNIEPAFKVVQRVWEVMDTKTEESWDWEKIIKDMNMDFLIT